MDAGPTLGQFRPRGADGLAASGWVWLCVPLVDARSLGWLYRMPERRRGPEYDSAVGPGVRSRRCRDRILGILDDGPATAELAALAFDGSGGARGGVGSGSASSRRPAADPSGGADVDTRARFSRSATSMIEYAS